MTLLISYSITISVQRNKKFVNCVFLCYDEFGDYMRIIGNDKQVIDVKVCMNFFNRFQGLMGVKGPINYGMFFPNCHSIHTCFMRFPIDVYIVDYNNIVVYKKGNVRPWRFVYSSKKGYGTYEFMVNTTNYQVGERIKQVA